MSMAMYMLVLSLAGFTLALLALCVAVMWLLGRRA